MEDILLGDPNLQITGPLDIKNKRYSVIQQPELGTISINRHTGSWVYTANEAVPSKDDSSTAKIGIASNSAVLVPVETNLNSSNANRTKAGTASTAAEYLLKINGNNISFMASDDGTSTGNGEYSSSLDPDMSFEIISNLEPGTTPYAVYDMGFPRLYLFVESDGTSTTTQLAEAINNTKLRAEGDTRRVNGSYVAPSSDYSNVDPSNIFFNSTAQKIEEITNINLTSTRMNKTKAGGIFYPWTAGNDNGDLMGDDAEIFISPTATGYYLLGCMGKGGYSAVFQTGSFNIIAEQVPADNFTTSAGNLIDVEKGGDLQRPISWNGETLKEN